MFWFQGQSGEHDFKILILSYQASEKENKRLTNIVMKFDRGLNTQGQKNFATWSKNFSKCTKLIPGMGVELCHMTTLILWAPSYFIVKMSQRNISKL